MELRNVRRAVMVGAGAVLFGSAAAALHGADGGTRASLGNLSVPWLLLPFWAGLIAGRGSVVWGALCGVAATLGGLFGFELANVWVLHVVGQNGVDSAWDVFAWVLAGTAFWGRFALVTGAIFGGLGARWPRTRSRLTLVLLAALAVCEPVGWLVYFRNLPGYDAFAANSVAWIIEMTVGLLAIMLLALQRIRKSRQPSHWPDSR
jgi:hypothetical protein